MSTRFNLCHDPWVVVLDERQARHEVGLIDAFRHADRWRAVAGEMPTQQAAILRLLLAILYRALRHDAYPDEAQAEWGEWWRGGLPVERIVGYLSEHEQRFELFDGAAPFMQVADLRTAKGSTSGLNKLIAEIPDGEQYFTTRAGRGLKSISAAEAARWLVHVHAFDPSGIKTGAVGDERVRGGKGYPIGIGWSGNVGLVLAEGRSLAETLLLNFVHESPSPEQDTAPWERAPATAAEDVSMASRPGPVGLLTWQSRRIRLISDSEGRVVDAIVCQGDRIGAQNRHRQEFSTAWRRSQNQEKSGVHGAVVYMPVTHMPERAVWRGLGALLSGASGKGAPKENSERLLPPVVEWLAGLTYKGRLDEDHPVRFRAVGAEYKNNSAVIGSVTDDAMALRAAVLTDAQLRTAVVDAVAATDLAVLALRNLAGNLAQAAGGNTEGPRANAGEEAWHALDQPFRHWAAGLTSESDISAALTQWHVSAFSELRAIADRLIREASDQAWIGREVAVGNKKSHLDSSLADVWFRSGLRKALDRAAPTKAKGEAEEQTDDSGGGPDSSGRPDDTLKESQ